MGNDILIVPDVHGRNFFDKTERIDPQIIQIIGHTPVLTQEPIIKDNFCLLNNKQLYLLHNNVIEKYFIQ